MPAYCSLAEKAIVACCMRVYWLAETPATSVEREAGGSAVVVVVESGNG